MTNQRIVEMAEWAGERRGPWVAMAWWSLASAVYFDSPPAAATCALLAATAFSEHAAVYAVLDLVVGPLNEAIA